MIIQTEIVIKSHPIFGDHVKFEMFVGEPDGGIVWNIVLKDPKNSKTPLLTGNRVRLVVNNGGETGLPAGR
jgi:hypothetical protein